MRFNYILISLYSVSAQVNGPLDADVTTLLPPFTGSLDIVGLIQTYYRDNRVGVPTFFKRGFWQKPAPPCDATQGNQAFRKLGCLFHIAKSCPGLACDSVIQYMPPFLQYHMNNPLVSSYRDFSYGLLKFGIKFLKGQNYDQKCLDILAEATQKLQAGQKIFANDAEMFAYLMIKYRFSTIINPDFADDAITYVYQTYAKVSTMTSQDLTAYIDYTLQQQRLQGFVKRAAISYAGGVLTYNSLLQSCTLTSTTSPDITAGCIAGIVVLCAKSADRRLCQKYYEQTYLASAYADVVKVCPKWKSGPFSNACKGTVQAYRDSKPTYYPFAEFSKSVIFTNDTFAPA